MRELNITDISCPVCKAQMIWADGNRFFCGGSDNHRELFIVISFEDDLDG